MKKFVSIFLALGLTLAAFAQPASDKKGPRPEEGRDRMQTEKIAFITRVVDLTPEEAQAFWPLYNQIEKQQKELFKAEHDAYRDLREAQNSGEGDMAALLRAYLSAKAANVDQHAANVEKYKKILPIDKVARFFTSEEQFRRELIGQLRSGRPGDKMPGKPSGKPFGKPEDSDEPHE